MKEKRKSETPKVEVLEVELRDAIANQSCAHEVSIGVTKPPAQKQPSIIEDIGGNKGSISWDEGSF